MIRFSAKHPFIHLFSVVRVQVMRLSHGSDGPRSGIRFPSAHSVQGWSIHKGLGWPRLSGPGNYQSGARASAPRWRHARTCTEGGIAISGGMGYAPCNEVPCARWNRRMSSFQSPVPVVGASHHDHAVAPMDRSDRAGRAVCVLHATRDMATQAVPYSIPRSFNACAAPRHGRP